MVAQKRLSYPKPLGAEIAQKNQVGFSRIPKKIWFENQHAGLYAVRLNRSKRSESANLQEMGKHFVKERKAKSSKSVKSRKNKQNVRVFAQGNKRNDRNCHVCPMYGCKKEMTACTSQEKPAFIPRQLRMNHKNGKSKVSRVNKKGSKIGLTSTKRSGKWNHQNKSYQARSQTNFDAAEISIMALQTKFQLAANAFASDAMTNEFYELDQQKKKLRMLNSLIHTCKGMGNHAKKARGILISNMAWKEKEMVRANCR